MMILIFDPDSGEYQTAYLTPEGQEIWQQHIRTPYWDWCKHVETEIRIRTIRDGRRVVQRQCMRCGDFQGTQLRAEQGRGVPDADQEIAKRYAEAREQARRAHRDEELAIIEMYRFDYAAYRQTPEWWERHRLCLERAGFLCEGCRKRKAEVAHHTTYRHIGKEFQFELLALCHRCHARWHGHDE